MASIGNILSRKIRAAYGESVEHYQELDRLVTGVKSAGVDISELETKLNEMNGIVKILSAKLDVASSIALELDEMPHLAERLSDLTFVAENLDKVRGVDYLALAEQLENASEQALEQALRELRSLEGGLDRLERLGRMVGEVMSDE